MPTSRAVFFCAAMIAAAILAHGYATWSNRYTMLAWHAGNVHGAARMDVHTGKIVFCEFGTTEPSGEWGFECK